MDDDVIRITGSSDRQGSHKEVNIELDVSSSDALVAKALDALVAIFAGDDSAVITGPGGYGTPEPQPRPPTRPQDD